MPPGGEVPLISSVSSLLRVYEYKHLQILGFKNKNTKPKKGCLPLDDRHLGLKTRKRLVYPDGATGFSWICEAQGGASHGEVPDSRGTFVYLVGWIWLSETV